MPIKSWPFFNRAFIEGASKYLRTFLKKMACLNDNRTKLAILCIKQVSLFFLFLNLTIFF